MKGYRKNYDLVDNSAVLKNESQYGELLILRQALYELNLVSS